MRFGSRGGRGHLAEAILVFLLALAWPAAATPRALGARLVRAANLDEVETAAVDRLVGWVETVRYAAPDADGAAGGDVLAGAWGRAAAPSGEDLRAELARVRGGLRRQATRGARVRALLAPRSLTRSGRDTVFVAEEESERDTILV